jgi:hypothetical protein
LIHVLFYDATLELSADETSYPGRDSILRGRFDYGEHPVPSGRDIQIYLDGGLLSRLTVGETFEHSVSLSPDTSVGSHSLRVVAPTRETYAAVSSETWLDVVLTQPTIELSPPTVALMPFPVSLNGRAYSEVGPLTGALVEMSLAERTVSTETAEDGTFEARVDIGMDLSFIGSWDVDVTVSPTESWNSPASLSRRLVVINPILIVVVVAILVLSSVRLYRRLPSMRVRTARPVPAPTPVSSVGGPIIEDSPPEVPVARKRTNRLVIDLYERFLGLLQGLTGIALRPESTLREFAAQCAPVLGPGQKYLERLTRLIERALYSRYDPETSDLEAGQELIHQVEESAALDSP